MCLLVCLFISPQVTGHIFSTRNLILSCFFSLNVDNCLPILLAFSPLLIKSDTEAFKLSNVIYGLRDANDIRNNKKNYSKFSLLKRSFTLFQVIFDVMVSMPCDKQFCARYFF